VFETIFAGNDDFLSVYPDMALDIVVQPDNSDSKKTWNPFRIIEINPLSRLTDPCLFTWDEIRRLSQVDESPLFLYKNKTGELGAEAPPTDDEGWKEKLGMQ
jgi:Uma2 family endonuclease